MHMHGYVHSNFGAVTSDLTTLKTSFANCYSLMLLLLLYWCY